MAGTWRYLAQHPFTGAILDPGVPLKDVSMTRRLSGPWAMTAKMSPEVERMMTPTGDRILDEWRVQVWAECDGVIRGGGILTGGQIVGSSWDLAFDGHLRYPYGIPYDGAYSRVQVDSLDAFREVWRHVQSYPDGDLGLVVDTVDSGLILGVEAVPAYFEVSFSRENAETAERVWVREDTVPPSTVNKPAKEKLQAAITDNATTLTLKELGNFAGVQAPFTIKIGSERIRVRDRDGKVLSRLVRGWDVEKQDGKPADGSAHAVNSDVEYDGTPRRKIERVPAEPYTLAWWDAVDCGDELETLAKETPFEYVETHDWNTARTGIDHRLRIGAPRLGRRRTDIAFVEGENLAAIPTEDRDGDAFAQYVIGLGAGEGRKRRRTATIGSPDGRLRRPWLLERSDVGSVDRLTRLAAQERAARATMAAIPDVLLKDHPNAPLGSWAMGDEVLVSLRRGWANESVWCRIVEETVTPESAGQVVALKLIRADGV